MNRFICMVGFALVISGPAMAQKSPSPNPAHDLARSMSNAFADVYERIAPGVVVIEALPARTPQVYSMNSPFAQFFLQDPGAGRPDSGEANQGSGFIITADGYVLTNNHVLGNAAPDGITVILKDGRKFSATIVGTDPITDLAVLKVKAANLPVVELGDSDKIRVGEFAFALGAPFDLRDTFTYGIISAKGRTDITRTPDYEEYLQTDASINPGNSGGPLVNIDGQVIGVNTLIRDFNRGLGFAIPINIAKKVATQLIAEGRAVRPWLGIQIQGMDDLPASVMDMLTKRYPDLPRGVIVKSIEEGTPAAMSDLRPGDVITKVNGTPVAAARELQKAIIDRQVGDQVELQVWRERQGLVQVKLRTAERISGYFPVSHSLRRPPGTDDEESMEPEEEAPAAPAPKPAPRKKAKPLPSPTGGLTVRTLTAEMAVTMKLQPEEGVLVTSVQPGSAAAAAGVQVGDVITSVGSAPVRTQEDFVREMRANDSDALMLNINRGDEKTYGILKL